MVKMVINLKEARFSLKLVGVKIFEIREVSVKTVN